MTDAIECRIRYYANVPQRTHRIVCDGKVVGHWWSDGSITLDEDLSAAPPVRASDDG